MQIKTPRYIHRKNWSLNEWASLEVVAEIDKNDDLPVLFEKLQPVADRALDITIEAIGSHCR